MFTSENAGFNRPDMAAHFYGTYFVKRVNRATDAGIGSASDANVVIRLQKGRTTVPFSHRRTRDICDGRVRSYKIQPDSNEFLTKCLQFVVVGGDEPGLRMSEA